MLHVGGARTALFNWLYARHTGGVFILRVEDTDRARHVEEAVQVILDGMRWLGVDWDEGPEAGGKHGPYFQSQRGEIYERYLGKLREAGHVYQDEAGAIRFRLPRQPVEFVDMVCGRNYVDRSKTTTPTGEPEADMTIRRPDGSWIFHFVNVVDDIEMAITHVIRGEDHLSNTPKHIELYRAFGVEPPRFAHIPLILNRDGSKMSKRDQGAGIGNYIEQGYVPEAVRNYLCLLGWSPKDDREKLDIEEVIRLFDPEKINRKAAQFDIEKCNWLNAQYIAAMDIEKFADAAIPWIEKAGIGFGSRDALLPVLTLIKEKIKQLPEVPGWIGYFFTDEYPYEPETVEKTLRKPGALDRLKQIADAYSMVESWDAAALESKLKETAVSLGCKPAEFIHPARVAVSGRGIGPSLYHMLEVLGKRRVLARFQGTIERFRG
ncbi:MAG: glutamyl-tRNA synthetase [Chthoniobacteraceae bacterium]|nr:glutamyl-tRNA synthetase [Chthoniobacteraceae bacterium]